MHFRIYMLYLLETNTVTTNFEPPGRGNQSTNAGVINLRDDGKQVYGEDSYEPEKEREVLHK